MVVLVVLPDPVSLLVQLLPVELVELVELVGLHMAAG